ncbi:MAG: hypothetical protein AB7F75_02785 [Planctomycetota bacterium]
MARQYKDKPFHLIASHCQSADNATIIAFLKDPCNMDENEPNFTVASQASHPGIKSKGIPYYGIFNHKGQLVKTSVGAVDDALIATLIKDTPSLYLGEAPFTKIADLAKQVEGGKNLGALLARLESIVAGGGDKPLSEADAALAGDETAKEECQRLIDVLVSYGEAKMNAALSLEGSTPSGLIPALNAIEKELAGSAFAKEKITKAITDYKASPDLKSAIKLENESKAILKSLERMKSCENCMRSGTKIFKPDCSTCKAANQKKISEASAKLEAMVAGKDNLPISKKILDAISAIK